ncbi:MAG: nitrate- and nitrite sensing domain-containing protein [Actinomycetota bacterium]
MSDHPRAAAVSGARGLARFSIRARLVALLLSALTGLGLFGFVIAVDRQSDAAEAAEVRQLIELGATTGDVVHEVQLERGATALFIASGGAEFREELQAQYGATDAAVERMRRFATDNEDNISADVLAPAIQVLADMEQLSASRSVVRAVPSQSAEILDWYTNVSNTLIDGVVAYNRSVTNADLRSGLAAYVELMKASQSAGLESGLLAAAFARDRYEPGELALVAQLMGARRTHLDSFADHATDDVREFFEVRRSSNAVNSIYAMENVALANPPGGFGQDPVVWFETMGVGLDLLREIETYQVDQLLATATAIQGDAQSSFRLAVGTATVLALIPMGLGLAIMRSLRHQFTVLTDQTATVASGRFDVEPLEVHADDELGRLTGSFNAMAATLRSMVDHMATSADDVAQQAEIASVRGAEVSSTVAAVSTAVTQIDHAIHEVSEGANRASVAAVDAVDVARESTDAVANLNASSDEIGEVVDTIRAIAKQTNLLALNATIEAARAGDAGRGFAVVANEVGELAAQTATAIDEIQRHIDAIRGRTDEVVDVNVRVSDTIDEIGEIFTTIAQAVEMQSSTTAAIGANLEEAAVSTQEIAGRIADLASAAKDNHQRAALTAG